VTLLERAWGVDASDPGVRLALGRALLDAGRARDAVPHLQQAVSAGTHGPVAAFDLARAHAAAGAVAAARDALRQVGDPSGLDAASATAVSRLALQLGEVERAVGAAQRAVGIAADAAPAREALGLALAAAGRSDEAIAELEVACRLDATSASARLNLALLYAESGRVADARSRAEEALRLQPDYTRAHEFLAALGEGRRDAKARR
jgi:tetratricopeptide (TPR) repeat protein